MASALAQISHTLTNINSRLRAVESAYPAVGGGAVPTTQPNQQQRLQVQPDSRSAPPVLKPAPPPEPVPVQQRQTAPSVTVDLTGDNDSPVTYSQTQNSVAAAPAPMTYVPPHRRVIMFSKNAVFPMQGKQ